MFKIAQKVHKNTIHNNVAKVVHWYQCGKWRFQRTKKWYLGKLEKILELENWKLLRDFPIETDKQTERNRPDITKKNKICQLIDPSCTFHVSS